MPDLDENGSVTYKVVPSGTGKAALGPTVTINRSSEIERQRYRFLVRQLNLPCGGAKAAGYLGE